MAERNRVNLELEGGNQLLQKYLAKAAADYCELDFETNIATYTGFVTGLDEKWVRITESLRDGKKARFSAVLLKVSNLNAVARTGRRITDLTHNEAEMVRTYTGLFNKASRGELAAAKLDQDQ